MFPDPTLSHEKWQGFKSLPYNEAHYYSNVYFHISLHCIKEKNPRRTVIGKRGCSLSYEGSETQLRSSQGSNPKKHKLSICTSQPEEREVVKRTRDCRAGEHFHHVCKKFFCTSCGPLAKKSFSLAFLSDSLPF